MIIKKLDEFPTGWLVGDFEPVLFNRDNVEVAYHTHKANEFHDIHYHRESTEYNLIIEGLMEVNSKVMQKGDIFILSPYEVSESRFMTDVKLIVIRDNSEPGDKYVIK